MRTFLRRIFFIVFACLACSIVEAQTYAYKYQYTVTANGVKTKTARVRIMYFTFDANKNKCYQSDKNGVALNSWGNYFAYQGTRNSVYTYKEIIPNNYLLLPSGFLHFSTDFKRLNIEDAYDKMGGGMMPNPNKGNIYVYEYTTDTEEQQDIPESLY